MDKLFTYDTEMMIQKLESVEAEMREANQIHDDIEDDEFSERAKKYIKDIFTYIKRVYRQEDWLVLTVVKEFYQIATTSEFAYLLKNLEGQSELAFDQLHGENGYEEIVYAVRLLSYYYLVREKRYHSEEVWKETQKNCQKVYNLGSLKKREKNIANETCKDLSSDYVPALRAHMDKHMVGQDSLKKTICIMLYQFLYQDTRSVLMMMGPSGCGKNHMITTLDAFPKLGLPVVTYDCSALTPNGFNGKDVSDIFKKVRRVTMMSNRVGDKCLVYLDEADKIINCNHDASGENVNYFVQQQLLSALAGTETIEGVDTSKCLFILGGAFPRIDDLKKEKRKNPVGFSSVDKTMTFDYKDSLRDQIMQIGAEKEFLARIDNIVEMSRLSKSELRTILVDKNIGVFTKKKKLYEDSGFHLEMDDETVDYIVELMEKDDAGARSITNIMNEFASNEYYYDMLMNHYTSMKIHKGMLYGERPIFA